jgi:hypothetical protein
VQECPTSQPAERLCRGCGTPVAHDHDGDLFCSACQRARRHYDPRHDPDFPEALLELLTSHPRRPLHVYRELGIEHCGLVAWRCVRDHIARFRRHGHQIVGRHDGTYEYRGRRVPRNARAARRRRRAS